MDFRGASAEAVVALTDQLKTAVSDSTTAAATAAGALFSVSQTVRSEPALRRFATDTTVPPEAKAGLVKEVFGSRLDQVALEVLTAAVSRRWTRSIDLPDGIERLSEVAAVLSAGERGGLLSEELFALRRIVDANPGLRDALSDPARSVDDKAGLLDSLLVGKVQPATLTLAKQALAGSYGTVSAALGAYRTLAGEVQGEGVATVHVAKPLTEEQTKRLMSALSQQYGRPIHLDVVVDPSILGGVRVEIGDAVIDGAVASRLDEAKRLLAG
jgi:F-type H+-transporting ATPase subunit delta